MLNHKSDNLLPSVLPYAYCFEKTIDKKFYMKNKRKKQQVILLNTSKFI